MAVKDERTRGEGLVAGAHRVIRLIDAEEGPFAGSLVAQGDLVAVQVPSEQLSGWAGWEAAGAEHIAAPIDVVRRTDGHDVLLPWCVERITVFLGRRSAAGQPLSAGEVSTLLASILRGIDEWGRTQVVGDGGRWWLTDDGRPMLVIGEGDDPRVSAALIVERLQKDCGDRVLGRVLSAIHAGLTEGAQRPRMSSRQLEQWEGELLATAAPRPLRRDVHAPERVRDIDLLRRVDVTAPESRRSVRGTTAVSRGRRERTVLRLVRPYAAAWRSALVSGWRRIPLRRSLRGEADPRDARFEERSSSRKWSVVPVGVAGAGATKKASAPRRRLVLVAGVAVAAVLGAGMLWPVRPQEHPEPRQSPSVVAADRPPAGGATGSGTANTAPPSSEPEEGPGDAVEAASGLLTTIAACAAAGDEICADAVVPGASGLVERINAAGFAATSPELALVDEYGDVAVIRMSSAESSATESGVPAVEQVLVIVRDEKRWLVRDVYDVADQPG